MIIIAPFLFAKSFRGMAIFPFILLKDNELKNNVVVINHEKIHLRQQIEMLWIFFFLWYFIEFLIHFVKLRDLDKAYLSISFEKEAYFNQDDLLYLKDRKFWSFLNYIRKNNKIR